jgi:hypothetical protein
MKGDLCSVPYVKLPALSAEEAGALFRELESLAPQSHTCRRDRAAMRQRRQTSNSPSCAATRKLFARGCTKSPATRQCSKRFCSPSVRCRRQTE